MTAGPGRWGDYKRLRGEVAHEGTGTSAGEPGESA